ncbi:MAG: malate dehydrogenase [Planctomycetes bacterium SM23_25]|nr:MAG: malate dehydrogenase [Planctomycetes bacterium SM23_25]
MIHPKITIVGAGNVGASCALWAAAADLGDIVLVDIVDGLAAGKALDLQQTAPIMGFAHAVTGTTDYEATAGSDLAIVTAGLARKPGMSRDDLLAKNAEIVSGIVRELVAASPGAVLVIVSNPVDAMTSLAHRVSDLPTGRVVGMAGVLDSARMRTFIAQAAGVSPKDVQAYVLGGHGDTMVPLVRHSSIGGVPLAARLAEEQIGTIVQRTRNGGAEIVGLLKTGSAFYAPAAAAVTMARSILKDERRVLPCAAYCDAEYGVGGCFVGVPARLGTGGVMEVLEFDLNADERAAFDSSVAHVRRLVEKLAELGY